MHDVTPHETLPLICTRFVNQTIVPAGICKVLKLTWLSAKDCLEELAKRSYAKRLPCGRYRVLGGAMD